MFGSMLWAILLLWPTDLFVPARTTYRLMSQVASENIWGFAFMLHAICAAISLFGDIKRKSIIIGDALWGTVLWTAVTIMCFASHWDIGVNYAPPAAAGVNAALMIATWWWLVRCILKDQRRG